MVAGRISFDSPWAAVYIANPHRGVEQLVAHRAHNPEAAGSNPAPATRVERHSALAECLFC